MTFGGEPAIWDTITPYPMAASQDLILLTGATGYLFGSAMRAVLKDLQHFEAWLAAGVILLASAIRHRLTRAVN